ncbi:MAG: hypothetical protein Q4F21_10525 [Lachnospiraceae bacterium]|nr:hypothetical protein [Lachnospiraceae bacterium]
MTTLTLNRNMDSADFLFVALNDSSCRDLRASRDQDLQRIIWGDERHPQNTMKAKLRKWFEKLGA